MAMKVGKWTVKTPEDLQVEDKTVFCRVDLNVPLQDGKVSDDTRIRAILPTVQYLLANGAKPVLASHLGRPKGKPSPQYSLLPVAEHLAGILGREVTLPDDCVGDGVKKILNDQRKGGVVLLENLRFHPEEERNDEAFAKALGERADIYINDAFGTMHRAHASTHALPRLFSERAAGFLVADELKHLTPLLESPARPYAVILGGAKVSDKVKIIETLIRKVDRIFIGGAMAFTFLKALGHRTGNSLVEEAMTGRAKAILDDARGRGVQVFLPKDFTLGRSVEEPGEAEPSEGYDIPDGRMGLDVGPLTVRYFSEGLKDAQTIFWNGPLGLFEKPPFDRGTVGLAEFLGELSSTRIIGGGDSAAAVAKAGAASKMTHISTGGGATLEYLEGKPLPGLEALAV